GLWARPGAPALGVRLDPTLAEGYLEQIPNQPREQVVALLRYPSDSAGGIMTNDVVTVASDVTIAEARRVLQKRLQAPDFVYYIYVLDGMESHRLLGVITLRELLVSD